MAFVKEEARDQKLNTKHTQDGQHNRLKQGRIRQKKEGARRGPAGSRHVQQNGEGKKIGYFNRLPIAPLCAFQLGQRVKKILGKIFLGKELACEF